MAARFLDTGTPHLLAEVRDGVAILTINRPEARNALGDSVSPMLRNMLAQCEEDDTVGAYLLTGAGAAFCAGGDIKSMAQADDTPPMTTAEKVAQLQERQRLLTGVLVSSRKPSVAALPGPAAGAGLSIALACDLRVAAKSAFVRTAYIRIGFSGDYGVSWLLTRAVGPGRARELMLLSEDVDAARCEQIGLVNKVTDDAELFDTAFEIARKLANGPRKAIGLIKDNLDDAMALDFLSALDNEAPRLYRSADSDEHRAALQGKK